MTLNLRGFDQKTFQTQSGTGHRRPLPSSTKDSQKYCQSSETSILELVSGAVARPVTVSNFHTPSGFPKRHVATRVTLHSGRNSQLRSPQGTAPALATLPDNLARSPPNTPPSPSLPQPPGHRAAQNNRTHQHFHLRPRASSDTAAAAVGPLRGTDRVLKSHRGWQPPPAPPPPSSPAIRAQTETDLDESATRGVADGAVLSLSFSQTH